MRREALAIILLGALLAVILTACGTKNVGVLEAATLNETHDASGVILGDYEVIRCNADGQFDPAMNSTLKLRLDDSSGEQALVISIEDSVLVSNVELEVRYDTAQIHADRIELAGIYGGSETVSLALADLPGKAAIGEVCVDQAPAVLSGEFATVYFADGPSRTVSANNGPHKNPLGVDDPVYPANENLANLLAESDAEAMTASLTWFGAWHRADGNQDSLVTVADITPIGVFFNQSVDDTWAAMRADYNRNRLVEVADIQPIGANYDTGTTQYRIEASDDSDGAALSLVKEVDWGGDEAMPYSTNKDDAVPGELYPVFTEWQMEFSTTSAFTWDSLQALDVNDNQMVRLHITPHDQTADSVSSFRDIEVGGEVQVADRIAITSYRVMVSGASGGVGGEDIFDEDNNFLTVQANTDITLTLESVSGSFNTDEFTGSDSGTWPADMTQEDYDDAFDAAKAAMEWSFIHGGAAGFRRTVDWLVLDSGETSPVTGDPGLGTVFPDEDEESDASNPEGGMSTNLPSETEAPGAYPITETLEIHVYSAIPYDYDVDVTVDPKAPTLLRYGDDPENPMTELLLNEDTFVPISFEWGDEVPSDFSLTALELHRIDQATGISMGPVETFDFISDLDPLEPGTYQIRPMGEEYSIFCVTPGAPLVADAKYAFRLFGAGVWSSINYPEDMLGTKPPPPPQDLKVVPVHGWPAIDVLQVFYEDQKVRRNPTMYYDFETGSLQPEDELAYNDILRNDGDEFFLQSTGGLYPRAAVKETDDPATITTLADNIDGVVSVADGPGRLLINVSLLSKVGSPDDPVKVYSFKFFNSDGSAVGQGTFDLAPLGNFNTQPVGRHWGVNAFDREELPLSGRHFDNAVHDGNTCGTSQPDVLWFEFGGGWMYDIDNQDETATYGTYPEDQINVMVYSRDVDQGDTQYMEMALRIVGLGATGDWLAIHTITNLDWRYPGVSGWPGQFRTGHRYQLSLDDPHYPGLDYTFPTNLIVTGDNPNTL
jgi:hypothetical protein